MAKLDYRKLDARNVPNDEEVMAMTEVLSKYDTHHMAACPTYGCGNKRRIASQKCSICVSFDNSINNYKNLIKKS